MRYLAIDLGDRRTGLALGDDVTGIASPVALLEVPIEAGGGETLLDALVRAIDRHTSREDTLVMGLPLNADGTDSPRARLARAWADRLAARTGRPVRLHDERRSTMRADERMARSGLTRGQKKARRDALAAAAILEDFLSRRAHPGAWPDDTGAPPADGTAPATETDR